MSSLKAIGGVKNKSTMGSITMASNSTATGTGDLPKIFGARNSDGSQLESSLRGLEARGSANSNLQKSMKMQPRDYHRISLMQKLKLEEEGTLPPFNEKVPAGLFRNVSPKMFITSQTPAPKDAYARSNYGKKQHYALVQA